ncbi:MAG: hypothetical protein JWR26_2071 [Pedosphaera sp.]|nr:hypothetical protein [Pedosphaera sp.]
MRLTRALFILLLLVGVIITILVVAIQTIADNRARYTTLPNGSTVEMLGTSVGTATFTTDKPWYRFARRWLPTRLQSWIPPNISASTGANTNQLVVWIRLPAACSNLPWAGALVEDETGFCYSRGNYYGIRGSGVGIWVYALRLNSYPRRQSSFPLQLFDSNGVIIGTLRVPNPVHGPFPVWRPLPLPQSQTNGPVTLSLLGLTAKLKQPWPLIAPQWRVDSADPSWSNSIVRYFSYQDPTGNEGQFLFPHEPAWKLRAVLFRKSLKSVSPGDRMSLTNLAVPGPGQLLSIDQTNICAGVSVKVLLFADAGQFAVASNGERLLLPANKPGTFSFRSSPGGKLSMDNNYNPTPFIILETQNMQPYDDLQVRLIDDGGFEIKGVTKTDHLQANGKMSHNIAFTPPETAKSLTLEILINRPLQFEFMVNPADVHPAKP